MFCQKGPFFYSTLFPTLVAPFLPHISVAANPAGFSLLNYGSNLDFHTLFQHALITNFPFFETWCELSPMTVCAHPLQTCRKAHISLVGYAFYKPNRAHTFNPIPCRPEPIHDYVCNSCGVPKGRCREECSSFLEELTRYTVYQWDIRAQQFIERVVTVTEYNPLYHGYFSYHLWRKEIREIEAKRREKRKRKESDEPLEEDQPTPKKSHRKTPSWTFPTPFELYLHSPLIVPHIL